ncbi:MAG: sulfurtransferase TusA family protein [Deltaproteobacteria bacterium]|nr:sulfurtransferase TusA family protein [Deltaproteobacteria bacterium]
MSELSATKELDAKGLVCPMPSVKTALALEGMKTGEVLKVITDDPVSKRDLPLWAKSTGNEVVGIEEDGTLINIYLKKIE